jgi:hypothetical protein
MRRRSSGSEGISDPTLRFGMHINIIYFPYIQCMRYAYLLLTALLLASCQPSAPINLDGTWRLLTGLTITKGDTTVTDYTKGKNMIKVINGTHFAFLSHDVGESKDSSNHFDAGGGSYELNGNQYTEHLDFYSDKNWEGKPFTFTVKLSGDTLIQQGQEKVEGTNIDREIIEKYVRIK